MRHLTRRRFLGDSLLATSAALAARAGSKTLAAAETGTTAGPNDQLRIAVIGTGGRGIGSHITEFLRQKDVAITAVCDADLSLAETAATRVEKATGRKPTVVQDMRRIMDDREIDAVSIATTNHWHALAAIWAMQAGKHVYVEKPVSHNVFEGRKAVEAARKHNRICQAGTQIRSNPGIREAIAFLRSGGIGTVYLARGLCYKSRGSIGQCGGEQQPPKSLDYNLWSGPAAVKPVLRKRFHYDWHWFWDYGNGDLGNQGIHQVDVARWGLGVDTLAKGVLSLGGRFGYTDDGETANTQLVFLDYGPSQLIFEVRGLKTEKLRGAGVGILFYGTDGTMVIDSYAHATVFGKNNEPAREFSGGNDTLHFRNFLDACRSGKHTDLRGDILEGHLSSALCHLGNISYRLGEQVPFDSDRKAFGDNKEAYETFARFEKHLADNGVQMDTSQYRLGKQLAFDPKRETFPTDPAAARMLTREYRKPFMVPEVV